jgi:Flp pilus assembly protein TadG
MMPRPASALRRFQRCDRGIAALEFALLAPPLLMLAFGIAVYSIYFSAYMGVRQAASEGARAAMAGLDSNERTQFATVRAEQVIDNYGAIFASGDGPQVTAAPIGVGVFEVRVSYDMSAHPIIRFTPFIPLPQTEIVSAVVVTNGSY